MSTTIPPVPGAPNPPTANGSAARSADHQSLPAPSHQAVPAASSAARRQSPEGRRLTQRITLLLGQRASLSRVMLLVLTAALIFGLIGFAAHALWIVSVIVLALGLGYLAANSRRDRSDAINQRQEDELDTARRG